MSRKYNKRIKSTSKKTYKDYLKYRAEKESKGYILKEAMTESEFEQYYEGLRKAKKAGEIKSQAWQYLTHKEIYLSSKQASKLALASQEMQKEGLLINSYNTKTIRMVNKAELSVIGTYLNMNKTADIYGGNYE